MSQTNQPTKQWWCPRHGIQNNIGMLIVKDSVKQAWCIECMTNMFDNFCERMEPYDKEKHHGPGQTA